MRGLPGAPTCGLRRRPTGGSPGPARWTGGIMPVDESRAANKSRNPLLNGSPVNHTLDTGRSGIDEPEPIG